MTDFSLHKYQTLDGIRGVAALLIVLFHTADYFGQVYFPESYLAVDLFFVLSGFVIAKAYAQRLADGLSAGGFMRLRLIRLYPLYALATVLGIVSFAASVLAGKNAAQWSTSDLIINSGLAILLLPSPFTPQLYAINAPSWSLFFELIANALYAVLHRFLNTSILLLTIAISAIALLACTVYFGSLDVGYKWTHAVGGIPRVLYSFCMGLLIARLSGVQGGVQGGAQSNDAVFSDALRRVLADFKLPSSILLLLTLLTLSVTPTDAIRPWYDLGAVLILFPLIVVLAARSEPRSLGLKKICIFLGAISYAIYVLHVPIFILVTIASKKLGLHDLADFAPFSGVLLLLVLVCFARIADRVYDQAMRRWLGQFLTRD
ncbi:peptidoglycan/LPS O-acetylase OafA/YrhL [Undibacterium sp. GrIS 1.8]|uniref:acyltransferase family protein n=1 Tax=unclassified Undibacterium TaxID=2630295 RepID=UPI003396D4F0